MHISSARLQSHCGFTLVEMLVVIGIITIIVAIVLPAIQHVRALSDRTICSSNLRQIGIALHGFHLDYHRLPPGCTYNNGMDPQPHMSWFTRLLPYVEQDALWNEAVLAFQQEKFFEVVPPHTALFAVVPLFLCPVEEREQGEFGAFRPALTSYQGVQGTDQFKKDGVLYLDSKIKLTDIADGASFTLMVGERPPNPRGNLGWWYAGWGMNKTGTADVVLGVRELNTFPGGRGCPPGPYEYVRGRLDVECDAYHFWSLHPLGANFLYADTSVRFTPYTANGALPSLATRNGHEHVELPE